MAFCISIISNCLNAVLPEHVSLLPSSTACSCTSEFKPIWKWSARFNKLTAWSACSYKHWRVCLIILSYTWVYLHTKITNLRNSVPWHGCVITVCPLRNSYVLKGTDNYDSKWASVSVNGQVISCWFLLFLCWAVPAFPLSWPPFPWPSHSSVVCLHSSLYVQ